MIRTLKWTTTTLLVCLVACDDQQTSPTESSSPPTTPEVVTEPETSTEERSFIDPFPVPFPTDTLGSDENIERVFKEILQGIEEGGQEAFERGRRTASPDWDGLKIGVVGRQHVWTTVYPGEDGELWTDDDLREEGRMTTPADQEIAVFLRSDDVLHALFIPTARFKKDVVPGRTNQNVMRAMDIGEYDYFCTEYCGQNHSTMIGKLHVVDVEDYKAHLAALQDDADQRAHDIQNNAE